MKKIMIVDDDPDVRKTIKKALEFFNPDCKVICVESGNKCYEMLKENNVLPHDIVLLGNGSYTGSELLRRHAIPSESAKWMAKRPIKMLGVDNSVLLESFEAIKNPTLESYATHDNLLKNDIPIIESLENLGKLKTNRFFFIAFPPKIAKLDSFPIRAVAIE